MTSPFVQLTERLNGKTVKVAPYVEIGTPGLPQSGGMIQAEFLRELQGSQGAKMYREMRDNSPMVGAITHAVEMLARETPYRVEGEDEASVELVQTALEDMSTSWDDTLIELLSCLTYGWSYLELVYKKRNGFNTAPGKSSRYDDGLIGWRKWAPRAQLTSRASRFQTTGTKLV